MKSILPATLAICALGQTPPPDAAARQAIVDRIRKAALEYGERLQNFTCTQITARSIGPSATGTRWKPLETQEMELNYVDHREHYTVLSVNGQTTNLRRRIKPGYFKAYGQFGSGLQSIFDPKSNGAFEWDHAESGAGGRVCVLRYRVRQASSNVVITADADQVRVGHHGMVWASCDTGEVTRFVSETDPAEVRRIGRRVPLGYRLDVHYALATIGAGEYLLPQSAVDVALFYKTWTKEETEFRGYRKYDASSSIRFEDVEAAPDR